MESSGVIMMGAVAVTVIAFLAGSLDRDSITRRPHDETLVAAGVAAGAVTSATLLALATRGRAKSRYAQQQRDFPTMVAEWREEQFAARRQWLTANAQIAREMERHAANARAERARISAINEQREQRNGSLGAPTIRVVAKPGPGR
jgi:hypothetical protein